MFISPVIGYRSWIISAGTYELKSPIITRQAWPTDHEVEARCIGFVEGSYVRCDPHISPEIGCRCGFYAWHEFKDATLQHSTNAFSIVGAVISWGKFVVAPRGFRMQYMRPLALADHFVQGGRPLGWPALLEQAIKKYKIPLLPVDLVQDYAETWGKPMGTDFTE